jgi:centrosomal protein CEP76
LKPSAGSSSASAESLAKLRSDQYYIHMHLVGGRAFTSELTDFPAGEAKYTVHLRFRNQRFRSNPAAVSVDPKWDDQFLVHLGPNSAVSFDTIRDGIHIVVTRNAEFVGSHLLDWRRVLKTGAASMAVELAGPDQDLAVPVGIVHLRLEVFPKLKPQHMVSEEALAQRKADEEAAAAEAERSLLMYAKQWWRGYAHKTRNVRLFSPSESGHSRPAMSFVSPLRADRVLETPRHAARFVSLIPLQKEGGLGAGRAEVWFSQHAFLARGRGDVANHALLLASLLLGFGLDAWVCCGIRGGVGHIWVLTRNHHSAPGSAAAGNNSSSQYIFWESTTGQRIVLGESDRLQKPYTNLDCVFNDRILYANSAPDSLLPTAQQAERFNSEFFAFEGRPERWMPFQLKAADMPDQYEPLTCSLLPSHVNALAVEKSLEDELSRFLVQFREHEGISASMTFDDDLSYVVAPALASYEYERVTGTVFGSDEFAAAIKHHVPAGYTFKGFPMQFSHMSASRIFHALSHAQVGSDVIRSSGHDLRFAVRVRVFAYPEDIVATWVMLAVMYKP